MTMQAPHTLKEQVDRTDVREQPVEVQIETLLDDLRGTPAEKLVNWERVAWLRPFGGIRIEDDVRVTRGDAENLTRDAFAALG